MVQKKLKLGGDADPVTKWNLLFSVYLTVTARHPVVLGPLEGEAGAELDQHHHVHLGPAHLPPPPVVAATNPPAGSERILAPWPASTWTTCSFTRLPAVSSSHTTILPSSFTKRKPGSWPLV